MRIGTRGSALALTQAGHVAGLLGALEGHSSIELVTITTSGDRAGASVAGSAEHGGGESTRGHETGRRGEGAQTAPADKSRWVDAIEAALLAGEIDLAVHSAKDVPAELAGGLSLLGAPARAAAEDVLCGADELEELAQGARVGTSSVRRTAQLKAAREDLDLVAIGGNVDTRLRRLRKPGSDEDALDAIVLARAGLQRLEREREAGAVLDPARFVPAPGQGVLALEGRAGDTAAAEAVRAINDADACACLLAERALASALGASCHTPLGAHATQAGRSCLDLRAWVGLPDGSAWISDRLRGDFDEPAVLGRRVAERMLAAGAGELLQRAQEMAVEHA